MKALIALAFALSALAQDAVTVSIKSATDGTTRTVALTGEAATAIVQATEYVAKTSCNPTCIYVNNVDVVRQNLAAFAVTILATIPGAKLETLAKAKEAANKALADEETRVQALVKAAAITEVKP